MALKDTIGPGTLALGLVASMAVAQNQIQISGSGRQFPPVTQGTVADATGTGSSAVTVARAGFADTSALTLTRIENGAYVSGLLLRNAYCGAETVSLAAQLLDRDNNPHPVSMTIERSQTVVAAGTPWTMAPGSYDAIIVKIIDPKPSSPTQSRVVDAVRAAFLSEPMNYGTWTRRLPLRGELVLSLHTSPTSGDPKGPCRPPVALASSPKRDLKLQPPTPSPVDTGVVVGSLALALLTTLIAAAIIFRSTLIFLTARMGNVTFDFTRSWGANVAIGTGLLAMLTGGAVLSQDQYSSNSTTYVVLGSLFAALVPLGAVLYGLIQPQVPTGDATKQPQGFVSVYLLSSGIVLWGAFGQLLLIGMLLREFELARVLSPVPAELLILISKGLIVVLMVYAVMNAIATVSAGSKRIEKDVTPSARPEATMI